MNQSNIYDIIFNQMANFLPISRKFLINLPFFQIDSEEQPEPKLDASSKDEPVSSAVTEEEVAETFFC